MAYLWDINGSSMGHQWLNPKEDPKKVEKKQVSYTEKTLRPLGGKAYPE
jgi:hypothetical protein